MQELTECQLRQKDKNNTKDMSKETVIEYVIGLLGEVKGWEEELDNLTTKLYQGSENDMGSIGKEIDDITNEMMSVNM